MVMRPSEDDIERPITTTENNELKELNESKVCDILNEIIEYEMAGVVRYAHSPPLMVTGPTESVIVTFLQEQANESLAHVP